MSHIAHLRKQFKWLYHNVKLREEKTHYLLFENLIVLNLNKLEFSSPKNTLCQIWLKFVQWFWIRKMIFKFRQLIILFRKYMYLPLERAGPYFFRNVNFLHSRMLCAKSSWNWPSGSGKEIFFKFCQCILVISYYLSLEMGGNLHLNKRESPSPKDA